MNKPLLPYHKKRCMDCWKCNNQICLWCSNEDQEACEWFVPNMTEKDLKNLIDKYLTNKKAIKIFKNMYKYMGDHKWKNSKKS